MMKDDENLTREREEFEFKKYDRQMNQQLAAHPHRYEKHSIEPVYGEYDRPINESV